MDAAMLSEKGSARNKNEDKCYFKIISEDNSWAIICDGMGGARGGEVASSLVVDIITREMQDFNYHFEDEDIKTFVVKAFDKANFEVFEKSNQNEELDGMGTTTVFALVMDKKAYVFHAGDSRAYLIKKEDETLEQITTDHSFVQEMLEAGKIDEKEVKTYPQKNLITRSLGVREEIKLDFSKVSFTEHDILLLLTDGVTNYVEKDEILDILKNSQSLISFAKNIIGAAKNSGSDDDSSVVVIKR